MVPWLLPTYYALYHILCSSDILKAIEECCSLDEYLKRFNFPLDVKASVKLLVELKVCIYVHKYTL